MTKAAPEEIGIYAVKTRELLRLLERGILPADQVLAGLQRLIEGDFSGVGDTPSQLIHGRFAPPEVQLKNVRRWNAEYNWGFSEADFSALGEAPSWPMDNPLACVVLVPSLKSVPDTFEALWSVAKDQQSNSWRSEELWSGPQDLRLLEGIKHQPGLRWVRVDLGAHWDRKSSVAP